MPPWPTLRSSANRPILGTLGGRKLSDGEAVATVAAYGSGAEGSGTRAEDIANGRRRGYGDGVCRNIRILHHFQPPTTDDEIRDAALQYVRKVSGVTAPSQADHEAFNQAVDEIAASTRKLLGRLSVRGAARTREGEREKARVKWAQRAARIAGG